jgi:accessory gene regulator protein AgrB
MPNIVKTVISLLVAAVAAGMFFYQDDIGLEVNKWIVVALALFMILALWLFPEAKARPRDPRKPGP